MITLLLIVLVVLWFLGYINISGLSLPDLTLFVINGHPVTLINLLTLLIVSVFIGVLPSPFREIVGVLLVLWILSILGIIAFAGLSSLLVIAIIVGIVLFVLGVRF